MGQHGSPEFHFPSTITILRLDVAESPLVVSDGTLTEVDCKFQSADPEIRLDVSGEGEVSAWELGTGSFFVNPILGMMNFIALSTGLMLQPKRIWTAFQKGCKSNNLTTIIFL